MKLFIEIRYYGPNVWQWKVEYDGRVYVGHSGTYEYIIEDVRAKMGAAFPVWTTIAPSVSGDNDVEKA